MTAKVGVITFPGSLDDHDALRAVEYCGLVPVQLWHASDSVGDVDAVILPGGFTYGDYLRCGAIARFAPIMTEVIERAGRGLPVLGICNGFQVLIEAGLLPGALMRNAGLKFVCRDVHLRVETSASPFTCALNAGAVIRVPVAHHDGNYVADADTLARLGDEDRIAFRYCRADGADAGEGDNPNGSLDAIAGILSRNRRVLGMMPHPERLADPALGGTDGIGVFRSLVRAMEPA